MFEFYGQSKHTLSRSIKGSASHTELVASAPGAKANLSEMTIGVLENGVRKPRPHNIAAIRQALEDAGIVFTVEGTPTLARSDDSVLPTEDRMWR